MIDVKSTCYNSLFVVLVLAIGSLPLKAQKIGVTSGIGFNSFFDFKKNSSHIYSQYKSGSNHFVKVDFMSLLPEMNYLDFSIKLERSTGAIETQYLLLGFCGLDFVSPAAPDINAEFELYRMAIDVLPLKVSIYKNIRLKGGIEVSRLFRVNSRDLNLELRGSSGNEFVPILPEDSELFRQYTVGFLFELQLGEYKLNDNLFLHPTYMANVSWLDEIKTSFDTKSLRHSFGVSLQWGMNKNPLRL